ncbi:glucosidase 2 subunit beta-like [Zingiber officinale]|uniref:glucosidase 2 subunit beta-like n=1 Tax=Zingiber officinale TaxID=94328 RepID=UPI001C4AB00D|nr:glucosidase 2 subunit beta-like [Zingiber officinale]XP_042411367.1 glucosidase 2 subunit beta-like [Zingiber officinale]
MGALRIKFSVTITCLFALWIAGFASLPAREFLGIAPQDEGYYKSDVIKCKDGAKKFTKQQLNDEFCDCLDGTDEPGTSACPEGKFYCRNSGHIPQIIFSSRVNDGLCDCCDGSDEYNGNVNCSNTCWEAGKAARERLKKKIEKHQDGLVIRKQEVEKAKQEFVKEEVELSKLKNEEKILKGLVEKLREHKERIKKAEEEERLKKEKEEAQRVAETKSNEQKQLLDEYPEDLPERPHDKLEKTSQYVKDDHGDSIAYDHGSDHKSHEVPSDHSTNQHVLEDKDITTVKAGANEETGTKEVHPDDAADQVQSPETTEGLSREKLGRLVASRWTGELSDKQTKEHNDKNEEEKENHDFAESGEEENYDSYYHSDTDDDRHQYDDEDDDNDFQDDADEPYGKDEVEYDDSSYTDKDFTSESPDTTTGSLSWLDKIQHTVQNVIQAFNFFRTPIDISESSRVNKEYDDASLKLSKLQSRISSLSEKLKHDFGKEKEFYSFYDQCFEYKQNKYVYKVCPFRKASQVEGHSTTQLGRWANFEESYSVMQFSNGEKCWNGPDRSLKVRLRCGLKYELADVDEPSRCEYVAILSTPISCREEKLKELQQKLEDLNKSQPLAHDEL